MAEKAGANRTRQLTRLACRTTEKVAADFKWRNAILAAHRAGATLAEIADTAEISEDVARAVVMGQPALNLEGQGA